MSGDWSELPSESQRRQRDARRDRPPTTNVEYVAGQIASVSVPLDKVPVDEAAWRAEIARVTKLTVPAHRRIELAQVRYWGDPQSPNVYCRFLISDREAQMTSPDAVKILHELRKGRRRRSLPQGYGLGQCTLGDDCEDIACVKAGHPGVVIARARPGGDSTFVLSWNDWQTAKAEGGGTAGLAARLKAAFDAAELRIAELRSAGRELGQLVIIGGGDMVEGCQIYANQSFEIDGDRRAQVRNTVAFVLAGIDQLAPLFRDVSVLVVGGNHGENRVNGKRTTRHDNDDCAVFEHAALATQRDPGLGHVRYVIAQDEPAKTLAVGPWILGTTHGHVFRNGAGGPSAKARRWFEGQAGGRQPVGDADILLTHHFHHFAAQDWGSCLWLQTPAMDGGSPHFTDGSGMDGRAGMLSWVMTPASRFTDMQILN